MPRVNPPRSPDFDRLSRKVEKFRTYRSLRGYKNWEPVANAIGVSIASFYRYMQSPGIMTDKFQHDLIRVLRIPDEEIRPYL